MPDRSQLTIRSLRAVVLAHRRPREADRIVAALVAAVAAVLATVVLLVGGAGVMLGLNLLPGAGLDDAVVPLVSPVLAACLLLGPAAGAQLGAWWGSDDGIDDVPAGALGGFAAGVVLAVDASVQSASHLRAPVWPVVLVALGLVTVGAWLPALLTDHRTRGPVLAAIVWFGASLPLAFVARVVLAPRLSAAGTGEVVRAASTSAGVAATVSPLLAMLAAAAGGWRATGGAADGRSVPPPRTPGQVWATAAGPLLGCGALTAAGCLAFGPGPVLHGHLPAATQVLALLSGGCLGTAARQRWAPAETADRRVNVDLGGFTAPGPPQPSQSRHDGVRTASAMFRASSAGRQVGADHGV